MEKEAFEIVLADNKWLSSMLSMKLIEIGASKISELVILRPPRLGRIDRSIPGWLPRSVILKAS